MKSNMKKQSYANKLTTSGVRKAGGLKDVEEEKGNVEELLQQEAELESSLLTVDEVVRGPVVPQPRAGDGVPPSFTRFQSGGPGPNIEPVGGLYPGHTPGHTPLNIYSPGSPPLPLPGPLHLVYLQPHPHGFNVIPFQAVGCPTFTPSSPLGFPAHPHHPVVVQSPQLPHPFPPVPPSKPHSDCPVQLTFLLQTSAPSTAQCSQCTSLLLDFTLLRPGHSCRLTRRTTNGETLRNCPDHGDHGRRRTLPPSKLTFQILKLAKLHKCPKIVIVEKLNYTVETLSNIFLSFRNDEF